MKTWLIMVATLWYLAAAAPASAHHVVWLDFSNWSLAATWPSVNGNTPPTNADHTAVIDQIIANMVEDYAPFDIYFTTVQPANGRYTRVFFYTDADPNYFGCAGGKCCRLGNCSGPNTWTYAVSEAEVYTGSFEADPANAFSGANATTARIANGISHTASHELGHIMGMSHCFSADDFVESGTSCPTTGGYTATSDDNVNWHIMAAGDTLLTTDLRATRDRFFNAHSERRLLYRRLQPRNHWAVLGNVNGGVGRADLTYGRLQSPTTIEWFNRLSSGSTFGNATTWTADFGTRADLFFTADVTGDTRADLIFGHVVNATTVRWVVAPSTGNSFGQATLWASNAGNAGDIFRFADVDNDGREDLIYGRATGSSLVAWYVRTSTGTSFAPFTTWATDAGNPGDVFLVGDVTGDGRADLVAYARDAYESARVYRSSGYNFVSLGVSSFALTSGSDYVLLGDVDGDGDADLVRGFVESATSVDWRVHTSGCFSGSLSGPCFGAAGAMWVRGAGDAGDLFRLGDGNGDGRMDLFYARPIGMTSLTSTPDLSRIQWYGRMSTAVSFGAYTVWANAANEGDIVP